MIKPTVLLWV